jgi:transposase
VLIVWSKDVIKGIAKRFGKSVSSSAHAQIRGMLSYKSPISGTTFVEDDSKYSTKTCSECGSLSGPSGFAGLSVRQWRCSACGADHDRDVNAARNTLFAGAGCAHEELAYV